MIKELERAIHSIEKNGLEYTKEDILEHPFCKTQPDFERWFLRFIHDARVWAFMVEMIRTFDDCILNCMTGEKKNG